MLTQTETFPGHPVAEAHWNMERFAFAARRCMELLAAWVWTSGNLDYKLAFGRQAFEHSVHADLFARRSAELLTSLPTYGWQPQPLDLVPLDRVFRDIVEAPSSSAKFGALYGALLPWLLGRHDAYLRTSDAISEGPTVRLLEQVVAEERRHLEWGQSRLNTELTPDQEASDEAAAWQARTERLLEHDTQMSTPAAEGPGPADPLLLIGGVQPASDPRMRLVYYTPSEGPSTPVDFDPQSETEVQQIMLTTLVSVETEAEELLCRLLVEFPDLPWLMRLQLARQMWDECRHAAAQRRILETLGATLGTWPAITYINRFVGDEPDVLKRLIVLQRVVEGISIDQHRPRGRYFLAQGMLPLVAMFDYVLADEDGHIALSRWIPIVVGDDAVRLRELDTYQARKEQEFSDFTDWLFSKRRDLQRLYQTSGAAEEPA